MTVWSRLCSLVIGYFMGTILAAEIVARRFAGKPAEEIGSGNPGMANILAHVGKKAGFLVLAGDILKTAAAMGAAWLLFRERTGMAVWYAGFGAVLGHNFPVWKKGRGGKGVTATCTWLILSMRLPGILCCLSGAAAVLIWGYLPLGAAVLACAAVPAAFLAAGAEAGILAAAGALIMISRHIRGLRRIAQGTEKRVFRKHRENSPGPRSSEK